MLEGKEMDVLQLEQLRLAPNDTTHIFQTTPPNSLGICLLLLASAISSRLASRRDQCRQAFPRVGVEANLVSNKEDEQIKRSYIDSIAERISTSTTDATVRNTSEADDKLPTQLQMFEKRFTNYRAPFSENIPLPWSCEKRQFYRDLGPDHFPRFVREVECHQKACWYEHYGCRPRKFVIKVLSRRTEDSLPGGVPTDISGQWMFRDVTVTLACECARL